MPETARHVPDPDREVSPEPGRAQQRQIMAGALFLALITLLAYATVFSAGYIWDDDAYVITNQTLRSGAGLARIWLEPGATPQYYPLVFSLFWAQFQLWGLDPVGYHLVNIILHTGNALLLWLCLRSLAIRSAFWVACIFAVHPVHLESVAWITELKNVLSTFFYLLAFLAYRRFAAMSAPGGAAPARAAVFYPLSLLCFLCALFSKTVAGSLPAVILLVAWWQHQEIRWRDVGLLLPFFGLAVMLGGNTARMEVTHVLAKGPEWDFSFAERLLIAGRAVWFYAGKLLWPSPLIFNYPRWQMHAGDWWLYLFPAAAAGVLFLLWLFRERVGRGPLAGSLFFVGTLFPALGFFNLYPMRYSFVADHFQYVASIGIIVLFCAGVDRLLGGKRQLWRHAAPLIFGLILTILTVLTWQQGKTYKNSMVLFSDVIAKNPDSWLSYGNRGRDHALQGHDDLALADLQHALVLNPDDADSLQCRGIILLKRREYDRALADLDRSIVLQPWRSDYYRNRSAANRTAGRLEQALIDAGKALELDPDDIEARLLRASVFGQREDHAPALNDLNQVLRLDPANFEAYANRGLISYRQGFPDKAIADFTRALSISPDSAATLFNRGLARAALDKPTEALEDLQQARRLGYPVSDAELNRILAPGNVRQ